VPGEPSGELDLVSGRQLDVHLAGPTRPAPSPARSGGRDGVAVVLSPGTADATTRLPSAHSSSAGVLAIRGEAWTWRPIVER
jgi:hypothetical protein